MDSNITKENVLRLVKAGRSLSQIASDLSLPADFVRRKLFPELFGKTLNDLKDDLYKRWFEARLAGATMADSSRILGEFTTEFASVGSLAASNTFKRIFGVRLGEYLRAANLGDEDILSAALESASQEEFKSALRLGTTRLTAIYERHGVANYRELKLKLTLEHGVRPRKPNDRAENLGLLLGMVIGDGHVTERGTIKMEHKYDHADFLVYKVKLLQQIIPQMKGPEAILDRKVACHGKVFYTATYHCSLISPKYKRVRQLLYPLGTKLITREVLDLLDERAVFIWFLDDGSLPINKKDEYRLPRLELCTDSFSRDENEVIRQYFSDRWGIEFRIKEIKAHTFGYGEPSGNTNYRLVITQLLEIAKFIELFIRPFQSEVPPSLRYKCCPQIYWSESLSTVNMCRANCQPECPHGIRVRRNAVLENRSASSLGASDA